MSKLFGRLGIKVRVSFNIRLDLGRTVITFRRTPRSAAKKSKKR